MAFSEYITTDIEIPCDEGKAMDDALFELCRQVVPFMEADNMKREDFRTEVISGGLTNTLFKASSLTSTVVIRVYGPESGRIINRATELFFQPMFIRTFGCGKNCLVYEYLEGYQALEPNQLSGALMPKIASAIAEFHWKATTQTFVFPPCCTEEIDIRIVLTAWMDNVRQPDVQEKIAAKGDEDLSLFKRLIAGIESEVQRLSDTTAALHREMPIMICHNDLLSANIMHRDTDNNILLIDFEYTHRNYLYFEFANHFNEYAGFDCDWTQFPTREKQIEFARHYFDALSMHTHNFKNPLSTSSSEKRLYALIQFCTLLSHIKWSLWAILYAAYSKIPFKYLQYANTRFSRFINTKVDIYQELENTQ